LDVLGVLDALDVGAQLAAQAAQAALDELGK
jgi:hypothetical protein